jgi:nucleoid-associated protein YgaU
MEDGVIERMRAALKNVIPYTVIGGETLSKIALRFYGYENLWDFIWLNSGANFHPDLIIPGQKLTLPWLRTLYSLI